MSWYDPRTWIPSDDGKSQAQLQAEGDALDAKIAANAEAKHAVYGDAWYNAVENHLATGATGSVNDAVATSFNQGAAEGLQAAQEAAKSIINGATGFLPTWLKVGLIAAGLGWLAWELGLFRKLVK